MKMPKDLTHKDFGIRYLTQGSASRAIGFIWKGAKLPWLFLDTETGKSFIGTKPRIGARFLTVDTSEGERRLPCPSSTDNATGVRWKFTIMRALKAS